MPQLSPSWERQDQDKKQGRPALTCGLALGICALALVCIAPALLFPIFLQARQAAQSGACIENLRAVAGAHLMYANDFDDELPGEAWMDSIKPYVDGDKEMSCPTQRTASGNTYGYAYAATLVGKRLSSIKSQKLEPLVFDSSVTTRNAVSGLSSLPNPPRHRGGTRNNVAYVDGHVSGGEKSKR